MVKTVAFVADSEAKPCRMHDTSPNTYEYLKLKRNRKYYFYTFRINYKYKIVAPICEVNKEISF